LAIILYKSTKQQVKPQPILAQQVAAHYNNINIKHIG